MKLWNHALTKSSFIYNIYTTLGNLAFSETLSTLLKASK